MARRAAVNLGKGSHVLGADLWLLQASAQSLCIGLSYGLGAVIGLMAAGAFYEAHGGRLLFLASPLVALVDASSGRRAPPREPLSGSREGARCSREEQPAWWIRR